MDKNSDLRQKGTDHNYLQCSHTTRLMTQILMHAPKKSGLRGNELPHTKDSKRSIIHQKTRQNVKKGTVK